MVTLTRREKFHQLKRLGLDYNFEEKIYYEKDYNNYIENYPEYTSSKRNLVISESPIEEIVF